MPYVGIKDIASCLNYNGIGPLVRYRGSQAVAIEYPGTGETIELVKKSVNETPVSMDIQQKESGRLDPDDHYIIEDF